MGVIELVYQQEWSQYGYLDFLYFYCVPVAHNTSQFPRLPELLALEELEIDLVLVCFDKITLVRTLHLSATCYTLTVPVLLLLITAGSSDYLSICAKRDKNVFV